LLAGKHGRLSWVVPEMIWITQAAKNRDVHWYLLSVDIYAALGPILGAAGAVHVERLGRICVISSNAFHYWLKYLYKPVKSRLYQLQIMIDQQFI